MALTSYSLYYFTQGPTPTQWANAYTRGPAGAAFNCYPSPTRTITDTFEWIATGNGCPIGYGLSSAQYGTYATCLWTGYFSPPQTFAWECLFTVGATAMTTVDGGTKTVANGNAITVTASPQTTTVTQTVQQTSTATSVVAPGAATVNVTSTVTRSGALAKKHQPQVVDSESNQMPVLGDINLGTDVEYSYSNTSNPLVERACSISCSNYCCDGRTCIGDGYHCCSTFSCVNYDPAAVFLDYGASYLQFQSFIATTTRLSYQTVTQYETVSVASGTVTVTPTSTVAITVTNIQTVSVVVTTTAGTVTVTVFTTVIVSSPPVTGPSTGPSTGPVGSTSTSISGLVLGSVTFVSKTGSLTHSPIPSWTGAGKLLVGYCTTPDFVLFTGPTAYWAPVVGCDQNKPDCCPFLVVTAAANYPVPQSTGQATLSSCPDDYQTVSNACCPSGYSIWSTSLGGQVPCFSTLQTPLTPPAIPSALITAIGHAADASSSQTSIQAIENFVYAMSYPVNSPPSGLSTGAQAGIGAGVGVVGLALIGLAIFFLLRRRRTQRRPESDPIPKVDPHHSGSTFQTVGPEHPGPNMQQTPTIPYVATQHQGIEHYQYPYANSNPVMPLRGYIPPENSTVASSGASPPQDHQAVPLGGYLPQEDPEYAPRPAYQSWPPIRDNHWQTAQGLQVSPPTSTASPPPDSRYGDGYSSPGSLTGLRPSELHGGHGPDLHARYTPELQGGQQERWELGGRP